MKAIIKKSGVFPYLLLMMVSTGQAQVAKEWTLDKAHTSVTFAVKHFFTTVNGNFTDYEGSFYFDPDKLSASKFTFSIPVSSINTNNKKRDADLVSDNFFNAEKYPEIKFVSTKFEKKSDTEFIVHGDLSIKDVTKSVAIPFEITGQMEHPMKKGTKILGQAFKTSLNRTDYKVGTGNWATTMVVGDNVDIEINLELNRKE
ncbi:MAG: YceI family protein [Flavobacteriaceae bacterium]|nr:YceI family protein [Flavobacteriaceae bacterium]